MSVQISEKMLEHGELTRRLKDLIIEYVPEGKFLVLKLKQKKNLYLIGIYWEIIFICH